MMRPKVASAAYILIGGLIVLVVMVTVAILKDINKDINKETTVTGEIVDCFYASTVAAGYRTAIVVKATDGNLYYLAACGEIDEFKQGLIIEVTFSNNCSMRSKESALVENPDGSKTVKTYMRHWWSIKRYRILSINPN